MESNIYSTNLKLILMKYTRIKSIVISAIIIWIIGVVTFIASYFVPIASDADLQANWVISIVLIPSTYLGAHIYYRNGYKTNGFILGSFIFLIAAILDAIITVPIFIIPNGGNYVSFFTDIGFWLIGLEIVIISVVYWKIKESIKTPELMTLS